MIYDLPQWIVDKYDNEFENQRSSYLRIHGGTFSRHQEQTQQQQPRSTGLSENHDEVVVDKKAQVEIKDSPFLDDYPGNRRRTSAKTGMSSVLIVRVTTNDATVDLDLATITDRVFGDYGTPASQYKACSMGKKQLLPASGFSNGALELFVNAKITGTNVMDFENTIKRDLVLVAGSLYSYDHIIYCLPGGSHGPSGNTDWHAYAYINWNTAFFNNKECGYLSSFVHELGHNMGLDHSGLGRLAYGDQSGIMGYSYERNNWPLMCFNSAKNWQLGWYSDKSIDLSADRSIIGTWAGRLYGYPDYESIPDNGHVLIKIGDIFIQYNKIAEMNKETQHKLSQVVFVQSTAANGSKSSSLAGLVSGTFEHNNLRVDVCGQQTEDGLDYYDIVVRDYTQESICHDLPDHNQVDSLSSCFSGESTVQVEDKGVISMSNLQVGDRVLVSENTYERVYSFAHRVESQAAEFVQIMPSKLELTKDHMMFVVGKGAIPASMLEVGDVLVNAEKVESIHKVVRTGIYSPFTPSGTIVVNGVLASNYITFQDSDVIKFGSLSTPFSYQWLSHASQFPHRVWCHYLGKTDTNLKNGFSNWTEPSFHAANWCLLQHLVVMGVLFLPFVSMLFLFGAVETMLLNPLLVAAAVAAIMIYRRTPKQKTAA
jgi:hypothetical protein